MTVAFVSRTLTATERKYSMVKKEALACVWAVEKWWPYLWGQHFTLRTDHCALTTGNQGYRPGWYACCPVVSKLALLHV